MGVIYDVQIYYLKGFYAPAVFSMASITGGAYGFARLDQQIREVTLPDGR